MCASSWPISQPKPSTLIRAMTLIGGALLLCPQLLSPPAALAQFKQDGNKLVGTLATGNASQGASVAVSADGSTAIVGGQYDHTSIGAAWIFHRTGEVWAQQGGKLVGTGSASSNVQQGTSVALSADGSTAIVGGPDNAEYVGAAWVFTRNGGVWSQQGDMLVGAGIAGGLASFGYSVALSGNGDTAVVGGPSDNDGLGAIWVFTRTNGVWSQQGGKLVGSDATGKSAQGWSAALSANGDAVIVGGPYDNGQSGAAWVFTRSAGVWSQQGGKLVGTGAVLGQYGDYQGWSVAIAKNGNTAIVGGPYDNANAGAAWVYTRSSGIWSQQGAKLVGTGAVGAAYQGVSVGLSLDGDTAVLGANGDNSSFGATWVFTRSGAVWTQQGDKLVGTGNVGAAYQGLSAGLSGDGDTLIAGGATDNLSAGAAWMFIQPLQVSPYPGVAVSGVQGGPFSPLSFSYKLRATTGSVKYSITNLPKWLTASSTSGTLTTTNTTVTFTVNANALAAGHYTSVFKINNASGKQANIPRTIDLTVKP